MVEGTQQADDRAQRKTSQKPPFSPTSRPTSPLLGPGKEMPTKWRGAGRPVTGAAELSQG